MDEKAVAVCGLDAEDGIEQEDAVGFENIVLAWGSDINAPEDECVVLKSFEDIEIIADKCNKKTTKDCNRDWDARPYRKYK